MTAGAQGGGRLKACAATTMLALSRDVPSERDTAFMVVPARFYVVYPLVGLLSLWGIVALWDTGTRSGLGFAAGALAIAAGGFCVGASNVRHFERPGASGSYGMPLAALLIGVPVVFAVRGKFDDDVLLWLCAVAGLGTCLGLPLTIAGRRLLRQQSASPSEDAGF